MTAWTGGGESPPLSMPSEIIITSEDQEAARSLLPDTQPSEEARQKAAHRKEPQAPRQIGLQEPLLSYPQDSRLPAVV